MTFNDVILRRHRFDVIFVRISVTAQHYFSPWYDSTSGIWSTLFIILGKMSNVCESCQQSYCDQLFTNIFSGSSDIPFNRIITYGCVSKLLTWAKSKQTALKDNKSRVDSVDVQQGTTARLVATFKNISELVRAVIRNIHTYGAGGSCHDSERQLKPNLPQFCHLNLSLIHIWRCRRIERCRSRWSPYH